MKSQIDKYKDLIVEILKKYDVKRASLFGSIVREEMTSESDIDLLVEFIGNKSLLDLVRLRIELEETLKLRFDVLTFNAIYPLLKDQILGEQVEIL
jgi:predicted nucleotidyltransferase